MQHTIISTWHQYKNINEIALFSAKSLKSRVFYPENTSEFRLATFQVLNMAIVLDNAGLYTLYYNPQISVPKLLLC